MSAKRLLVHAFIISDSNGRFFVQIIRNPEIDETRLSGFVGALKLFGEETLGKIKDIKITGLDINLLVVSKYNLVSIIILDSDLPEFNMREGCEKLLDTFYTHYVDVIKDWNGSLAPFKEFKTLMEELIQHFFGLLKTYRKEHKLETPTKKKKRGETRIANFEGIKEKLMEYNKRFFNEENE